TLGTGWAFLFDGVTFAVSALCIVAMRVRAGFDAEASELLTRQIRNGLSYVRSQTWIVVSLVIAAVSLFCVWGPYETLMPLVVTVQLHGSGLALALVFAAGGLGSVIVGIVMAQRSEEHTSELQSRGHLVCRLLLE